MQVAGAWITLRKAKWLRNFKKKGMQQLTECFPQDGNKNKAARAPPQRQIPVVSSPFVCRFHTHVNTPAEETAEHKAFFFVCFFCSGSAPSRSRRLWGHAERASVWQRQRKCISQPCCVFLAGGSCVEFTLEKLHFCFDLIKAKYWAIVRHLAGVCLTL